MLIRKENLQKISTVCLEKPESLFFLLLFLTEGWTDISNYRVLRLGKYLKTKLKGRKERKNMKKRILTDKTRINRKSRNLS